MDAARREPMVAWARVCSMETRVTDVSTDVAGRVPFEPFEAFYRANSDRLYRALALSLSNDDLAREAADEAMVRVYARWNRVRELDNPVGWAYRVGLNWAMSWWRKRRRERAPVGDDWHPGNEPTDPAVVAARAALDCLPRNQRAVVVCRVMLEFSTAETAAVLGIASGTVKSRLSRALADLRTGFTQEG